MWHFRYRRCVVLACLLALAVLGCDRRRHVEERRRVEGQCILRNTGRWPPQPCCFLVPHPSEAWGCMVPRALAFGATQANWSELGVADTDPP